MGITKDEVSIVEHDGPPPRPSDPAGLDDHLLSSQVAEVLNDDARPGG